nr:MAG TPA_asm: hypothetical protein [Caudoviricetes sp.]
MYLLTRNCNITFKKWQCNLGDLSLYKIKVLIFLYLYIYLVEVIKSLRVSLKVILLIVKLLE